MKKSYAKFLFATVFSICIVTLFSGYCYAELLGDGSLENPYLIGSVADWNEYADEIENSEQPSYAKLTADITLSAKRRNLTDLCGELDGDGHKISGITVPLYNKINNANIKNLVLDSVNVTQPSASTDVGTGGIARSAIDSTFENCSVEGSVTGKIQVGAIVGFIKGNVSISNCISSANVTSSTNTSNAAAGGIVGCVSGVFNLNIENCIAMGTVTAKTYAGGLVGSCESNATTTSEIKITNSAALQNKIAGNSSKSGRIYGGGNKSFSINGTNVYSYENMEGEYGNSLNNYHGTALVSLTDCQSKSFWSSLFNESTDWRYKSFSVPSLNTTSGTEMPSCDITDYLKTTIEIDAQTVSVTNADGECVLILAVFDGNRFIDMTALAITADTTRNISDIITLSENSTLYAMLWSELDEMTPLCTKQMLAPTASSAITLDFTEYDEITFADGEYTVTITSRW